MPADGRWDLTRRLRINTFFYHTLENPKLGWVLHYGPVVDSASNRNEYQEYIMGAKRWPVGRTGNVTNFMCRLSRNSESLKRL
jgi:hypothetical protein